MIRKHNPRKSQGEKCKPIYKAVAFPAFPATTDFFQGALELLGLGSPIEICLLDLEEQCRGQHTSQKILKLIERSQFSVL